jgi:predicted nucleic acid-binding protein
VIDTPILIAYRDEWPDAVSFMLAIRQTGQPECSQISVFALLVWCQNALNVAGVRAFLSQATVHAVTAHTMRRAQRLLESLVPPSGLRPDDAIIAATAIEHSLPLYTLDLGRFANLPGLATVQAY